jgi:transcriptional regulator with XRE-family HTH domain
MQSIGERLEEARKRRGVSLREASEATKIRGDFLQNFENNQFEVGLPEIYVRGFLRNYASFLKLEPDKIVADRDAAAGGDLRASRKEPRELFGRMELPERQRAEPPSAPGAPGAPSRRRSEDTEEGLREVPGPDIAMYVKIGAGIAAIVVAVLVIVLLVQWIVRGSGSSGGAEPGAAAVASGASEQTITLVAVDDVRVKVTRVSDNAVIFDGPLAPGETRALVAAGKINLRYDKGANLLIEWKGQRYKMGTAQMGFSTFPPN